MTLAEAVKPKYGGKFLAVAAFFRFLAVTTLAEAVKPKCGGNFSAILPYGGNFSAVSGFESFNDWGGRGCRKFVPVLGGDGTKIALSGDIFD